MISAREISAIDINVAIEGCLEQPYAGINREILADVPIESALKALIGSTGRIVSEIGK